MTHEETTKLTGIELSRAQVSALTGWREDAIEAWRFEPDENGVLSLIVDLIDDYVERRRASGDA